ncbi:MAG: aminopeptidase [Candidatus Hodarchaeales archaeon]|jgi:leucyl aminopeptidase (aminopeptidase T)
MFDVKQVYSEHNEPIQDKYRASLNRIQEIITVTQDIQDSNRKIYFDFFHETGKLILKLSEMEGFLSYEHFYSKSLEDLQAENQDLYFELLTDNYKTSYANPSHCVKIFGEKYGQLLSYFYCLFRGYVNYIFFHKIFLMEEYNQLFIKVYEYIKRAENIDYDQLKTLMTEVQIKDKSIFQFYRYKEMYDKNFEFYTEIVENSDFDDYRYLFRAGKYITDNELKTAQFLSSYSSEKLKNLAKVIVKAYIRGFERDNKLEYLKTKTTIGLYYKIGLERLYKEIIREFRKKDLKTIFLSSYSTQPNKQYEFDHKFDNALYLSKEFNEMTLKSLEYAMKQNHEALKEYSGILYIQDFGEKLFSPEPKKEILKLSPDQQKQFQEFNTEIFQVREKYISSAETSFCIVGFPVPEIGEQYEAIFEETMNLNTLDSEKYETIQQKMIDILDKADYVHVKGKGMNKTDFRIKIQPLEDHTSQTNFVNSGASVNIPAGEVFTAPQLKGTNGVLHVEETYQAGFRYDNLSIEFVDGYVTSYSCTNFETEDENKKYIEENLLFPHKTLPIGEFAIGTNTLAYMMARKYNIMKLLPILIYEKTGPHFALGDTCFSRQEDVIMYNQTNNKQICAVDNEKSIQRKTNPQEAYTNKHSDIVLGFDSIGFITAILYDEEKVDIIRDGRFTLKGTEDLNQPLNQD